MWRSLLNRLLPSKYHQTRLPAGQDPTVAAAAPILPELSNESFSRCIHNHQWNPDNTCMIRLPAEPSPHKPLPKCGFWSPSSSYISSSSNNLPWTTSSPPDTDVARPEFPNGEQENTSGATALRRVLAIGRREGECIRRRRKICKIISPEELVKGLGVMLMDRSTDIYYEVVKREPEEPVRRRPYIVVEEVDDSDDEC